MSATFDLAPRDDLEAVKAQLRSTGRAQIPGFFSVAAANSIAASLREFADWRLAFNREADVYDLDHTMLAALQPQVYRQILTVAEQGGRSSFQYVYDDFRITPELDGGGTAPDVFALFYLYLNSSEFLDFARSLTGEPKITYVDVRATRYRPGHFLTMHDDDNADTNRLFAYVFNFTPQWRAAWGGLLLFHGADDSIVEGFTPAFNGLNLFRVPAMHSVSMVTPAAAGPRLSFTGWMRADERPDFIGPEAPFAQMLARWTNRTGSP